MKKKTKGIVTAFAGVLVAIGGISAGYGVYRFHLWLFDCTFRDGEGFLSMFAGMIAGCAVVAAGIGLLASGAVDATTPDTGDTTP